MSADILLIGSLQPLEVDGEVLATRMQNRAVAASLKRIDIEDPVTLMSLQVMSNRNVRGYAGDGPLNTEDHPVLEFLAPRAFFVNSGVSDIDANDERMIHPEPDTYLMRRVARLPLTDAEKRRVGMFHAEPLRGHPFLAFFLLSDVARRDAADTHLLRVLVDLCSRIGKANEQLMYLEMLADRMPADAPLQAEYAWAHFEHSRQAASSLEQTSTAIAETRLRRAIALVSDTVDTYRTRLADIFFATGRYALAMDQYARAIQIRESHSRDQYISSDALFTRLAQCLYKTGDGSRALGYALQAANMNPNNDEARDLIQSIWNEGAGSSAVPH